MDPTIDYKAIVEELRDRLLTIQNNLDAGQNEICNDIRFRLASMLDVDPDIPLETLIDQLAQKWQNDGLY